MILESIPGKKKDEFELVDDVRKVKQPSIDFGTNYYVYQFPDMPAKFNKQYFANKEKVNLYLFTCTCDQFKTNSEKYQGRDIRKACKHINYKASSSSLRAFVGDITVYLLKIAIFEGLDYLYKVDIYGKDYYIIIKPNSPWIKVLTINEEVNSTAEYLYHCLEHRWGYLRKPAQDLFVVDQIVKIIKYQFPLDHPLKK